MESHATLSSITVAPYAGAWIEMHLVVHHDGGQPSRPTRARGLKWRGSTTCPSTRRVAPYAGAWIEITATRTARRPVFVAPYAGAWIEIEAVDLLRRLQYVAPYAGAWIEIAKLRRMIYVGYGRAPRGRVD